MKTIQSTFLVILLQLVIFGDSSAQNPDVVLPLKHSNSESFEKEENSPQTERNIVLVSVTPSGTVSLVGEDLPSLVLGQPGENPKPEIASAEFVECHCFGKITSDCYSTGAIGANYSLPCKTKKHQKDCCGRVKNYFADLSAAHKQSIADCLCNKNIADGKEIFASAAVATKDYEKCDGKVGTLHQKPAYSVTTCKCPSGWLSDDNVDGGVTRNGICKKLVCGPWDAKAFPPPNPGVIVGTWGFTWQNQLWANGTKANGGESICTTVNYPKGPCTMTWE
ncbi:MAG: hypothetical protein H7246_02395 [Phycisphaerae bacterium]|nr:hypothetical protein [Saprospiraceae bacterium]